MKSKAFVVALVCALMAVANASASLIDIASNYETATWTNGSNLGSGFGAWNLVSGANSGFFIWDSTEHGHGDINTSDLAFGFWGNSGSWADANRGITTWGNNHSFSMDMAVQWRAGAYGLNLYNVSDTALFDGSTLIWNFNIDDSGYGGTGWDYYSDIVLNFSLVQNGSDLDITVTGSSVNGSWTDTWNTQVAGETLGGFRVYAGSGEAASGQRNLYINNLEVIPEPTTLGLLGVGTLGLLLIRRKKQQA